ncbi:hypothetical protein mRhiFer1_009505 [Rhinolophus ferrumequinum]|uniref:Uncharacterized protein n=1 Tax=Rhinolophus ferrumequinum TaxID=59479 RepID=A0A7J7RB05_RHIFE|nr:hypothetical protein mRhiFer1_009505 [Rhinolophus ferrumequinum]
MRPAREGLAFPKLFPPSVALPLSHVSSSHYVAPASARKAGPAERRPRRQPAWRPQGGAGEPRCTPTSPGGGFSPGPASTVLRSQEEGLWGSTFCAETPSLQQLQAKWAWSHGERGSLASACHQQVGSVSHFLTRVPSQVGLGRFLPEKNKRRKK